MKASPKSSLRQVNLLLFYFILIQSTYYAIATTPKPTSSFTSLETLPLPATNINKTNEVGGSESPLSSITSPTQADSGESSEIIDEDDLDSSAATSNINKVPRGSIKVEEQLAAPSITTVHQVWASSSSDSLDELSPEVISKLRNDVPFLAAYSIRPRLVGGVSSNPYGNQQSGALASPSSYTTQLQAPSTAASDIVASRTRGDNGLSISQTSAANSPQSPLSKLGNFNEFKVETSSTSKSEHHHKRKTILKRRGEDQQPGELKSKRRQMLNTASQLMAKRRFKSKRNNRFTKRIGSVVGRGGRNNKKKSRRDLQLSGRLIKRAKNAAQRNQAKTGRLRRRLNGRNLQHHLNVIKHGKYLQEQPIELGTAKDGTPLDSTEVGSDDSGVKGGFKDGSVGGNKRTPFYAKAKPQLNEDETSDENLSGNSLSGNNGAAKAGSDEEEKSILSERGEEREDEEEGGNEESAAPLPEPRRVGDDDVEEEGDTVTVIPKYDGVDDDPEPVDDAGSDKSANGEREEPSREGTEMADGASESEKFDDREPRTQRVNRERPNQMDNKSVIGGDGIVSGGGVGATIGGDGSGSNNSDDGTDPSESDRTNYDSSRMKQETESKPANDKDNREPSRIDNTDRLSSMGDRGSSVGTDRISDAEEDSISDERKSAGDIERIGETKPDRGDTDRRQGGAAGSENETNKASSGEDSSGRGDTSTSMARSEEENSDVDYRDEMAAEGERKKKRPQHDDDSSKGGNSTRKNKEDCDDGQNHFSDHGDNHHHDHHDTIKWLQDAIPGEPGIDYPIISKVNLTSFNCRDQKYPGYYADVSSRCQIFHICQADGRQDSFLCPNGTIFSQISSVCVWWNSFDCEDAPKYYKLNELLYKSRPRSSFMNDDDRSQADLRPLEVGAPQVGSRRRANGDEVDESSIDSLIRDMQPEKAVGRRHEGDETGVTYEANSARRDAMGGRGAGGKAVMMDSSIGAYDEASIQRKSTNSIDEDSSGLEEDSARLRNQRRTRRKRRASAKQSPPKLKPGRYGRRRAVGKTINKIRGPAIKQKRRA